MMARACWFTSLVFLALLPALARGEKVSEDAAGGAAVVQADADGNVHDDDHSEARLLLDNLENQPNVTCAGGKNNNYEILSRFPGMVNASLC
jgi:hypothetical protein